MKWWPYYRGHYLLKKIDLEDLFLIYDHEQTMDILDSLLIEDSIYDESNSGQVIKKRASLNKDYGRIGTAIDEDHTPQRGSGGEIVYEESEEKGLIGIDERLFQGGSP